MDIREAKFPVSIFFHCFHEGVRDREGDIEVRDGSFVGLACYKIFYIRMVHSQNAHISAPTCATLRNFAKGIVINFKEADWSCSLTS